jgi:tRNA pseudouridine38-40 synthase
MSSAGSSPEKKKYLCVLAYLGAAYHGFERQKKYRTIQGEVEKCLSVLLDKDTEIKGAGRTDAGVSAEGQTFSFESPLEITEPDRFLDSFNRLLPSDIAVRSVKEVPLSFDARHSASGKVYAYSYRFGEKDPFEAYRVSQMGDREFDYGAFASCLRLYVGRHDFRDFTTKSEDKDGFVRTVEVTLHPKDPEGKEATVVFRGNGFMTYQVRIMMGAAFKVGLHKMALDDVRKHLSPQERHIISYKAPPWGLTLKEVLYE